MSGTIRCKFCNKICVKYRRTFFDSYILTFCSDLKHNSYKERKNLLLSTLKAKCHTGQKKDNNSNLNFLVAFLRIYKCYIQEQIHE